MKNLKVALLISVFAIFSLATFVYSQDQRTQISHPSSSSNNQAQADTASEVTAAEPEKQESAPASTTPATETTPVATSAVSATSITEVAPVAAQPKKTASKTVDVNEAELQKITEEVKKAKAEQITEEKVIKKIEISGNKAINESTIISKIKTRVNQPYYSRIAKDDIKRLYATGFFSDVSIDIKVFEDGLKVLIAVEEKPIVDTIDIQGMRILRKDLIIRKTLKTKVNQYLDYNQLKEDVDAIGKEYQKKGYSDVKVEYKTNIDKATNKAKVVFNVTENKRIKIKRVYVVGNNTIGRNKILGAIKTKRARLFSSGIYKEGEFQDDLERIKILYISEGFSDVEIDHKFEYDDRGFMYITFMIKEGQRYKINNVVIQGNKVFTSDELTSKLEEAVPGKWYSELAIQKDIYNLRDYYLGKGYLFVQIKDAASVDSKTGKVNISYDIQENDVVYVDRIDIQGNTKTKDKVIRREIRLKPGDRFDGEKLKRTRERLDNLGFFQEVNFDNEPGSGPDKENLIVDVKEAQTGSFSFGGGYSTVDQLIGFVEIEQKNFDIFNFPNFTGGGQDLALRAELGSVMENFYLSFTEPWMFDHPVSFGFDVFRTMHDQNNDVGYGYSEKNTGGDIRLGKEFSEYVRGNMMYKLEQISISDVPSEASNDLKKEEGDSILSSMDFTLTKDTRDSVFDPRKGSVLSGTFGDVGGPLGGDKDFLKLYGSFSNYHSIGKKSVIELDLKAGGLFTYSDTKEVPIYSRFFVGGSDTIRGYNERKVGPVDSVTEDPLGGEAMIVANIEYRYKILDFMSLAAFFDTGNAWSEVGDFGKGGFKSGIGIGVRMKTPIGPIKLDYGFPLNKEPGKETREGRFHFSVSKAF